MPKLQAMDLTSLKAVLAELTPALLPSRFEKAQQANGQTLQLGLRSLAGTHWLELSWLAEAPRIHAIAPPPRQGEGSTLAQQVQHGLRGLALVALLQNGWERVVELGFARRPGDPIERWLVLELMGRHSNLFLLDGERQIISLARQVREQQSRLRPIATGDPYQLPPPLQGEAPGVDVSLASWQRRLQLQDLPLGQALLRSYQGISPALVAQMLPPELAALPVTQLTPAQWQQLYQHWQLWLEALGQQRFVFSRRGEGYCCWPAPLGPSDTAGVLPPTEQLGDMPLNAALARYYSHALARRQQLALQQQWQQRLVQLLQREQRLQREQQLLLLEGEQADALQQQADALLCTPSPDREMIDRAQALYRRARRLRRSGAAIGARISLHEQRIAWFEASLTYLEQAESLEALLQLLADLSAGLETGPEPGGRQRRGRNPAPAEQPRPLELTSPGGLRLQVGRNHRQNEWISLRQARRGDLWFHAQECPGSHVVLKASERDPADADLAVAAHVAAYFSRARGNGRVPVVMVPTTSLQRIAGAQPGTVRHSGGEVIWGRPAEALAWLDRASSVPPEPSA